MMDCHIILQYGSTPCDKKLILLRTPDPLSAIGDDLGA